MRKQILAALLALILSLSAIAAAEPLGTTPGNALTGLGTVIEHGDSLYLTDDTRSRVYRASADLTEMELLIDEMNYGRFRSLNILDGRLYFCHYAAGVETLYRAELDGTGLVPIAEMDTSDEGLIAMDGWMYYHRGNTLGRVSLQDGTKEDIAWVPNFRDYTIVDGMLLAPDRENLALLTMDGAETLATIGATGDVGGTVDRFDVIDGWVYCIVSDLSVQRVVRFRLDGSDVQVLCDLPMTGKVLLNAYGDHLYINFDWETLYRVATSEKPDAEFVFKWSEGLHAVSLTADWIIINCSIVLAHDGTYVRTLVFD